MYMILLTQVLRVASHGRLIVPPSRSSAFRFGFNTPANYDDHGKGCVSKVNCGICGDPPGSRKHEAPGRYATGTLTGRYKAGQTIKVTTQITKNHRGTVEFKLCVNNNFKKDKTQACFDR